MVFSKERYRWLVGGSGGLCTNPAWCSRVIFGATTWGFFTYLGGVGGLAGRQRIFFFAGYACCVATSSQCWGILGTGLRGVGFDCILFCYSSYRFSLSVSCLSTTRVMFGDVIRLRQYYYSFCPNFSGYWVGWGWFSLLHLFLAPMFFLGGNVLHIWGSNWCFVGAFDGAGRATLVETPSLSWSVVIVIPCWRSSAAACDIYHFFGGWAHRQPGSR